MLGDVRKLEIERQLKAEEIARIDENIAAVRGELDATTARITALDESARAARPQLKARLVEIYKLGRARYVRLLLAAPDVQGSARPHARSRRLPPWIARASRRFSRRSTS